MVQKIIRSFSNLCVNTTSFILATNIRTFISQFDTCEACKDFGHSDPHRAIDICHPPYQDQVLEGIHSDHLSVSPKQVFLRKSTQV